MPLPDKGVENPRNAMLAEIVNGRTTVLVGELKEGGATEDEIKAVQNPPVVDEGDPTRPESIPAEEWAGMSDEDKGAARKSEEARVAETAPTETEEEKAAREAKEKEAADAAAAKPKVKIKVDGVEQEVDQDAVLAAGVRAMQKESAADKRLEEATKARDEAERLRLSVEATIAKLPGNAAAAKKSDQEMIVEKDALREIVKAIQYGNPEEAADALQQYGEKMAQLGQTNALTKAELQNMLDLREAQQYVRTNYADVVEDQNLKSLLVSKINEKLAAGDSRPYQEIAKEIGDGLRQWKGTAKPAPILPKDGKRADVRERKSNVVTVPVASVRKPEVIQPKEPSQSELIEAARKARHQA